MEKAVSMDGVVCMALQRIHVRTQDGDSLGAKAVWWYNSSEEESTQQNSALLKTTSSFASTRRKTGHLGEKEMVVWVFHQGLPDPRDFTVL